MPSLNAGSTVLMVIPSSPTVRSSSVSPACVSNATGLYKFWAPAELSLNEKHVLEGVIRDIRRNRERGGEASRGVGVGSAK